MNYPKKHISPYFIYPDLNPSTNNLSIQTEPIKPTYSSTNHSLFSFIIYSCAFLIVPIVAVNSKSTAGIIISIILSLTIGILRILYVSNEESSKIVRHINDLKLYEEKIKKYKEYINQIDNYLNRAEMLNNLKKENEEGYNHLIYDAKINFLKKAKVPINIDHNNIKKGISEKYFYNYLLNYFGAKILSNQMVTDNFEVTYFPDFVLYEESYNIYIDIEIDEPYVSETGAPIHFIGHDDYRDNSFVEMGWFVLRLTEKQIIQTPLGCCKLIENYLNDIIESLKKYSPLITVKFRNEIEYDDPWDYEQGIKMSNEKYRNSYLPNELKFSHKLYEQQPKKINSNKDLPF